MTATKTGDCSIMMLPSLILCLFLLIDGSMATSIVTPPPTDSSTLKATRDTLTSDNTALFEAVRLLLSEVSELKDENNSLRRDFREAQSEISELQQKNEVLSQDIVKTTDALELVIRSAKHKSTQQKATTSNSWASKLRGTTDDTGALKERLEVLEDKLACVSDDSNSYDLLFEGCNVHVRDGSGSTQGTGYAAEQSGRGNLIIGYNEKADPEEAPEVCSNSSASDFAACRRTGGVWGQGLQSGIHNLIVGAGHSYTRHSGIIAGIHNGITGVGAVVIGGKSNVASGDYATISGGVENISSGKSSVVLGGFDNTASGDDSLVGGGSYNTAGGAVSTVVGGENNQALGDLSFISGGNLNRAFGEYACSTSSFSTTATGKETAIAGGRGVIAALDETIVTGELFGMVTNDDTAAIAAGI